MKTGIFGGSFNPIHNGHIALAKSIKQLAGLDEVWFVVSPHNPLKDAEGLMPDEERLRMVEMALENEEGLLASDYEFRLPRPSFMANTLRSLSHDYPDREFTLIIGADNWLCFDKWREPDFILNNFRIAVYPRLGCEIDKNSLPDNVDFYDTGLHNVSSTQIRQLLKVGKPINGLVPDSIAAYLEGKAIAKEKKPLISVIIPVYNKREYVEDCLNSVLTQDFDSFEVIAVEDGSTDGSGEICDKMAREHPNLTVVHPENGGVTAARRLGFELSKGEFITFVDADDKMLPGALHILYDEIMATGADEVMARYIDQCDNLCGHEGGQYMQPSWMIKQLLASRADFCVLWAVLFRRKLLEGCLSTPRLIRSGEDILMQIECLLKEPKVWFSDEVVYMYNVGLPNDRPLSLDEQQMYDDILYSIFKDRMEEYAPYIVLHQTKMYENFIYKKQFDVYDKYYKLLRKADKSRLSIADRIAIALPPSIAYYPIAHRKNK